MEAAAPEPSPAFLLQLPLDVLQKIWLELREDSDESNAEQHAMRSSCRAMRDASNAWIRSCSIDLCHLTPVNPEGNPSHNPLLARAFSQLSRFPQAALLRRLSWTCYMVDHRGEPLFGDGLTLLAKQSRDLPSVFWEQSCTRLSCLNSVTFSCEALSHADIKTLVDTCPQLQHLAINDAYVTGSFFAPLQRLRSLSSLGLHNVRTPIHNRDLLMCSLAPLTNLTKLHTCDKRQAGSAISIASIACLPWVATLHQLRELHVAFWNRNEGAAAAEALLQHVSSLQHLTSLQAEACWFPSKLLPLASMHTLVEVRLPQQTLDTSLIRLFASMPRMMIVEAEYIKPDTDLTQLPCRWEELVLQQSTPLRYLMRMPRGIKRMQSDCGAHWTLCEGDNLEQACSGLEEVAKLLAEKRGWDMPVCPLLYATPAIPTALAEGSHGMQATQGLHDQEGAWSTLFKALAPLQLQQRLQYMVVGTCRLDASFVPLGVQLLPEARGLVVNPSNPAFCSFLEALGATGWLKEVDIGTWGTPHVPADAEEALWKMALQRAREGHSLELYGATWLTSAQREELNQVVAQHCRPACEVVVTAREY